MGPGTRYDEHVGWYEQFRPELNADEVDVLHRFLGRGTGRCLDLGCGTGAAIPELVALGWEVTGVDLSDAMLEQARARAGGSELLRARAEALPFEDATFDACVSIWTHTDVDDFGTVVAEASRILRSQATFVYVGAHPCFVGPHSRFISAEGVPTLHEGYRRTGRYDDGPAISEEGLRARAGAVHLPLGDFISAFLDAGFAIQAFEELGAPAREYPYVLALRCRKP